MPAVLASTNYFRKTMCLNAQTLFADDDDCCYDCHFGCVKTEDVCPSNPALAGLSSWVILAGDDAVDVVAVGG